MSLLNVVRHQDANIGDRMSSPALYFPQLSSARLLDPHDDDAREVERNGGVPELVIVGGGGQLANATPQFDGNLKTVSAWPAFTVAWGVGHNTHHSSDTTYPDYLSSFDMVGVRDWGTEHAWVPCASCMHPLFDAGRRIERPVVLYEHWQIPSGVHGLPTMRNSEPSMSAVLDFLGSAGLVVTNTYHGWYWATLLGRPVVLVSPFSTKFARLPYPPAVAAPDTWRDAAESARTYPEALQECRAANTAFAAEVRTRRSQPLQLH